MAKDGTNRGGPRPGTGPKKKPLLDRIQDGTAKGTMVMPDDLPEPADIEGSDIPPVHEKVADTLVATDYKDPPLINDKDGADYIVRRLTPTECARLQGFPDWWCNDLGTEKPTDEEMYFWYQVFETYRDVTNPGGKMKTSNQIRKWLQNPASDSAEYKMWGNGVALPCVVFVLSGIVYYAQKSGS